jgi:NADH-quinone oxidoreductase subunit A
MSMTALYAPIAILGAITLAFGLLILALTFVIGPRRPSTVKEDVYESGLVPIGPGRRRMPVRFYLTAALFILFDIEVVYLFPWAVTFRDLSQPPPAGIGSSALWIMAAFLGVLALGLVYVWRKGVLDWSDREVAS